MSLSDRILESFGRLTKASQAKANYAIPWEYAVSEATSTTFTGKATSTDCPHPDLVGIPLMSGIAGTLIKPAVGSLVGVMFLNGDPTRPRCVSWDQTVAESVGLAGGGAALHRVGDAGTAGTVQVSPSDASGTGLLFTNAAGETFSVPITFVGGAVVVGPGVPPGPFTLKTEATTGSEKVSSG